MPRPCTICAHAERSAIDRRLVAGEPHVQLADEFGVGRSSLARHFDGHIVPSIAESAAVREVAEAHHASDLLGEVVRIKERAEVLLDKAEAQNDIPAATGALRELRRTVELLGRVTGELASATPTVNVLNVEGWSELRSAILRALEPHQGARLAVVRALREAQAV